MLHQVMHSSLLPGKETENWHDKSKKKRATKVEFQFFPSDHIRTKNVEVTIP